MSIQQSMLDAIEQELQKQIARLDEPRTGQFHEMLTYHMGWTGAGAGPVATGKRIRPLCPNRRERGRLPRPARR